MLEILTALIPKRVTEMQGISSRKTTLILQTLILKAKHVCFSGCMPAGISLDTAGS